MRRATQGRRKLVASVIGVTPNAVDKMCSLPVGCGGEGTPSFVERLILATRALRDVGAETSEDFITYACVQLGYFPPVRISAIPANPIDLQIPAAITKERGETLGVWVRAFQNGTLEIGEAEDFCREITDELTLLGAWLLGVQHFITAHDEQLVAERKPAKRCGPRIEVKRRASA